MTTNENVEFSLLGIFTKWGGDGGDVSYVGIKKIKK